MAQAIVETSTFSKQGGEASRAHNRRYTAAATATRPIVNEYLSSRSSNMVTAKYGSAIIGLRR